MEKLVIASKRVGGAGGSCLGGDLFAVEFLRDIVPRHGKHQGVAEPGHDMAIVVLSLLRRGGGKRLGFEGEPLGLAKLLDVGIGSLPFSLLLVLTAASAAAFRSAWCWATALACRSALDSKPFGVA